MSAKCVVFFTKENKWDLQISHEISLMQRIPQPCSVWASYVVRSRGIRREGAENARVYKFKLSYF